MRHSTRLRLAALAVLVTAGAGAVAAWWYPSWRYARDYRAAEQAYAAYDFATARQLLAKCAERRPSDPEVQLLACRAARRAGDLTSAEEHYSRYRQLVREASSDALLERALLDAQNGRVQDVRDDLIYHLDAKHPRTEEILEALVVGSINLYNLERATFWIDELLKIAPNNPIGRLHKANCLATFGRVDEAMTILRDLIRDFPRSVEARLALAPLLLTTKDVPEAVQVFADARAIAPDEPRAIAGLARSLLRVNKLDEFRQLIPDLERLGENSEALLYLGRFANLERRWADAERYLSHASRLAPRDGEIHRELGVCLFQLGKNSEAEIHARLAREIEADLVNLEKQLGRMLESPRDPEPRLEAGRICLRNGQNAEGLRWLFGALELAPTHKPTHQALADYYASIGNTERAAYHRAQAK
jgi:Flp pilus assembly protein TadD